jgi:hypothetical protein
MFYITTTYKNATCQWDCQFASNVSELKQKAKSK